MNSNSVVCVVFTMVTGWAWLAVAQTPPPASLPEPPLLDAPSPSIGPLKPEGPSGDPNKEPSGEPSREAPIPPMPLGGPPAPALLPPEPDAAPLPTPNTTFDDPKDPPLPSVEFAVDDVALAGLDDSDSLPGVSRAEDLEATRFQGLQAGKSTMADALERLGEPLQKTPIHRASQESPALEARSSHRASQEQPPEPASPANSDSNAPHEIREVVWSYQVGPFPRVELTFRGDLIQSIFVVVDGLPGASEVAKQLRVDGFREADVLDGKGRTLGVAYPERGVMLALRPRQPEGALGVHSILLEPVNAELFVLRARNTNSEQCQHRLSDLNTAIHLDVKNPEAHGLKARILAMLGNVDEALRHCEYAIRLDDEAAEWSLLAARLHAAMGTTVKPIEQVKQLLANPELPEMLQAEANLLLGDLLALSGEHDQAMPYHKAAIALAAAYRKSEFVDVRRDALRVLANGHLAIANDVAWGNWRRKADVVPQWVKAGHRFADILISHENEEEILAQRVQRLTLSAYAGFAEWIDPSSVSREALEHGLEMIEAANDPLHERRVKWELAETMYHSMVAERRRGAYKSAVEFAQMASPLFADAQKQRKLTPREKYMVGELHFLAGSCMAVEKEDHESAVQWYNRGAHLLLEPFPQGVVVDTAELGDQLVSMGVSHWRMKQMDRAIAVTMRGAQLLQQVHSDRLAASATDEAKKLEPSLRIAFGNLSAMLKASGRGDEARRWHERLTELPPVTRR